MKHRIVQVEEKLPFFQSLPLSLQHLFAMFGSSVLVPTMFGINPAVVLFMNGIGTIGYLLICKGKVPAFLGPSFAFLPPALLILGANKTLWANNYPLLLGGFIAAGVIFVIVSGIIKLFGNNWLKMVFPPAVTGPIVTLIGLCLVQTAASMAGIISSSGVYDFKSITIAMIAFFTAVFSALLLRRFFSVVPVLIAIIVGYISALLFGVVDVAKIAVAPFFALPNFSWPQYNATAIITIAPAVFVVISEHIGHFILTQHIIKRDIAKNPGIANSLFGNGLFTIISGLVGSVPTTTYGENISVITMTRVYSVWVIGGAAVLSMLIAFFGKFVAVVQTMPASLIGGISLFLFGVIAAAGIRIAVEEQVDYSRNKNLILSAIVLVIGISGVTIKIGTAQLTGISLATLIGMLVSLVFHMLEKFRLTNEPPFEPPV